jgi:hypothetical protein
MSCYFGHHVHPTRRITAVNEMTGNYAAGSNSGNILTAKQMTLLLDSIAAIICYNNFQRGISLEDQGGGRSSAYFFGTRQGAHQIVPFSNKHFDGYYVPTTYIEPAIPLPWGMPAYKQFNRNNPAGFFST